MNAPPRDLARAAATAAVAAALFVPLFASGRYGPLDFWWSLAIAAAAGSAWVAATDPAFRAALRADLAAGAGRKILLGLASAAVLYGVFAIGNRLARWALPFAGGEIGRVYDFRGGAPWTRIVPLMALAIGPGEELLWRAGLQRQLEPPGRLRALLGASLLYAVVHVGTGNRMLVAAALVCGLYWGAMWTRWRSPLANVVSHVAWDLLVFAALPFGGAGG